MDDAPHLVSHPVFEFRRGMDHVIDVFLAHPRGCRRRSLFFFCEICLYSFWMIHRRQQIMGCSSDHGRRPSG